jgi:tetratricopeptide (TPR) repeat protein
MARVEKTVFISYRRTNAPWALAIYQNLNNNGYDVFFDFNGIASGDFEGVILGNIKARAHFIVLLTPSALERCNEPGDWLRREIETALDTKRNIVPLMLEGFDFGTPAIANQLTGKLAILKSYNALRVPAEYFMEAMNRLREKFLNVPLEGVLHPASPSVERVTKKQQAAADTAPAVQEEELTAQQWFERGVDTKDLDEKIRFYSQAIHLKSDFAVAFNNRGFARYNKGDLEDALRDYNEAIRLKPDYADAFYNRGIARRFKDDLEGALQDYDEAIRLKPDFAEAFINRGNASKDKGVIKDALQDYNKAIRLKPDYAEAFYNRGIVRNDKGDIAGALKDYNEAIRLKPDYADTFYNRGIVRDDKGDLEDALRDYNEAIRLKPDYAFAFGNRGDIRRRKGDLEGALRDYNEAVRLKPDNTNDIYGRALVFSDKRNYEAAIADFQKYLDLGGGVRGGNQQKVEEKIRDLRKKLEGTRGK